MINIVIAEDHQALLDGIKLLFQYNDNISILGMANNGEELLEIIRLKQPQIVITDIRMPKLDGIAATRIITKEFPHIKVIAFSMFDQDAAINQMRDAGAMGYVLKTSPLDSIENAITAVMSGQEYYDVTLSSSNDAFTNTEKAISPLSKSEQKILKLIAQNKTSSEIAALRFSAVSTVEKQRKNMIRKLGLKGKGELLRYAIEKNMTFKNTMLFKNTL